MKPEDIDKIWKEKLDSLYENPTGIRWDRNMGWRSYRIMQKRQTKQDYTAYYVAAGVAIMVTLTAIFINLSSSKNYLPITIIAQENKEVSLPNNHKCTLRQGSTMTFINGAVGRADTIKLEGEAYCELSLRNKVVIKAKNAVIACHKATLNVRAWNDEQNVIITSIDGDAYVSQDKNIDVTLAVNPNEKCTVHHSNLLIDKETNEDPNFLAWKTGELEFNNTPLNVAARTIADYYHVSISFKDENIEYCRFTSNFKQTSIDQVLKNIQLSLNATVIKNNNNILLAGGNCR
jgi:transmembrane sensor